MHIRDQLHVATTAQCFKCMSNLSTIAERLKSCEQSQAQKQNTLIWLTTAVDVCRFQSMVCQLEKHMPHPPLDWGSY
jgi:hypothetical protein